MKKIFLAASILIAATSFAGSVTANATTMSLVKGGGVHISQSQVPAPVLASFNSSFPNATNVQWERETEHGRTTYQADFYMNGKRWRATFAANGTLLSAGPKK